MVRSCTHPPTSEIRSKDSPDQGLHLWTGTNRAMPVEDKSNRHPVISPGTCRARCGTTRSARGRSREPLAFPARRVHDGRTGPQRRGRFHELGSDSDTPDGRPDRRGGFGQDDLAEALLLRAGELSRAGTVEQGNTVCDHEPEEIARGMTLGLSLALMRWSDPDGVEHTLTLVDTPGHPDFVGGVDTALAVADVALVAVSAVDGVTAGTRFAWAAAEAAGVPRIVVVTQEDKARADFRRVLGELQAAFGEGLWALELPLGEEQAFHGDRGRAQRAGPRVRRRGPPSRRPDAGRDRGRGAPDARRGDRGDRVARRRPARGVPRGERAVGPRARALARTGGRDGRGGARGRLLRRDRHRRRPRGRPALQPGAVVPRPRQPHHRRRIGRRRGRHRAPRSPRAPTARRCCRCSAPWPTRSSGRCRCSRCSRAWCTRATGCTTPRPAPTSASTACSGCGAPSTCRSTRCGPARSARSPSSRDRRRGPCCGRARTARRGRPRNRGASRCSR